MRQGNIIDEARETEVGFAGISEQQKNPGLVVTLDDFARKHY